jgi:hypothetical protein
MYNCITFFRAVVFSLFCSRTPRYNFSSTLYPQNCWYIMQVIHTYCIIHVPLVEYHCFRALLSWTHTGPNRVGPARHGTVRSGKTKWKQMEGRSLHRPGPSAGIGTVAEYWTEPNLPKVRSARKVNNCFEEKSFLFFSSDLICISLS